MSSILADTPTVANLATIVIDRLPKEEDLAIIDALLAEVQNMSPKEIRAQMEGKD